MPDLVSTPYKGIALGVEKLGVKFAKPSEVIDQHRENAVHIDNLRAVRRPIDRPELRPRGIHRCLPQYAVTFENNFHPMSGTITDEVAAIDRVRGFLYIETAFYKVVIFIATINSMIRRPFFWPLYNENPIIFFRGQRPTFVSATLNSWKATLQLLYCCLVGYILWKYLMMLMYTFNYDFLSAIAGPFLCHPVLAYHLATQIRVMDPYRGTNFSLPRIFECYFAWLFVVADITFLPVWRLFSTVIRYIMVEGISKSLKAIKDLFGIIVEIYEQTYTYPTKYLTKRGVILELIHLIYTLVWILWPQAFIWGYLSIGADLSLIFKLRVIWDNSAVDMVKKLVYKASDSTFGAVWRWFASEIVAAYNFFLQNALIKGIISGLDFIQNIWVLGGIIRLAIWLTKKLFGLVAWPIFSIFGLRFLYNILSSYIANLTSTQGQQDAGTGGSLLPKILLSIFILSTKIGWAVKILKNKDNVFVNKQGR